MRGSAYVARSRGLKIPAAIFRRGAPQLGYWSRPSRSKTIGVWFIFLWFFVGGIAHFVFTEAEVAIVPPWIPWPRAAVLVSGIFELLGALGLIVAKTRRAAGVGLLLLTLAVTPVHLYMLERPDLFSIPYWALIARLPLQAGLLFLIVWSCVGPKR